MLLQSLNGAAWRVVCTLDFCLPQQVSAFTLPLLASRYQTKRVSGCTKQWDLNR